MFISPVNFTGATKYIYSKDTTKQEMTVEVKLAEDARRHGVEVPSYKGQVFPEGLALKYFIEGDPADPKTNPIMQAHLENLFSNFYKLEEIGLHHSLLNSNKGETILKQTQNGVFIRMAVLNNIIETRRF